MTETTAEPTKFKDLAGREIKLGDIVAFAAGGGRRSSSLGFGRVMYFTPKGLTVAEGYYRDSSYKWYDDTTKTWTEVPAGWSVNYKKNLQFPEKCVIIGMSSLPKELFEKFDALDITGKRK